MKSFKVNGLTLHIGEDDRCGESPRDTNDNLGQMLTWHRRYSIGNENPYPDSQDFWDDKDLQNGIFTYRKVWLLDHSGLRLSDGPFACDPEGWDSDVLGIVYAAKDKVIERYGDLSEETKVKVLDDLKNEIEDYDHYLNATYFFFLIEGLNGETLESVGGFNYEDNAEMLKAMKEHAAKEYYPLFDAAIAKTCGLEM